MAKWRRGGGRRGGRWVIEYVPKAVEPKPVEPEPEPITPEVKKTVDPFEHDDPYDIRNALAAMENEPAAESAEIVN